MQEENTPAPFSGAKIGVAGLGLIGGSLAMAFRRAGFEVRGCDIDADTVARARSSGVFAACSASPGTLADADFVFLALYPDGIVPFLESAAPSLKKGAVVVDCCGIKEHICAGAETAARQSGLTFVGGHPMAGTERSGFTAASPSLYDGASFILTPSDTVPERVIAALNALLRRAGFARVVLTDPAHHDRMIAFTSQLPHALACAYVHSPSCPEHRGYSAGSYRDVSRVAHINPPLWAELFTGNHRALVAELDDFLTNLREIRDAVAAGDRETLTRLLESAREIKDRVDA